METSHLVHCVNSLGGVQRIKIEDLSTNQVPCFALTLLSRLQTTLSRCRSLDIKKLGGKAIEVVNPKLRTLIDQRKWLRECGEEKATDFGSHKVLISHLDRDMLSVLISEITHIGRFVQNRRTNSRSSRAQQNVRHDLVVFHNFKVWLKSFLRTIKELDDFTKGYTGEQRTRPHKRKHDFDIDPNYGPEVKQPRLERLSMPAKLTTTSQRKSTFSVNSYLRFDATAKEHDICSNRSRNTSERTLYNNQSDNHRIKPVSQLSTMVRSSTPPTQESKSGVAASILRAAGRHPLFPPLNGHLRDVLSSRDIIRGKIANHSTLSVAQTQNILIHEAKEWWNRKQLYSK